MASKHVTTSPCPGFRQACQFSPRSAGIGGLAGMGLTLPLLFAQRARCSPMSNEQTGGSAFGRAKQIISLYLHGGHPQQETFDPKPDGPSAVRGEFGRDRHERCRECSSARCCRSRHRLAASAGGRAVDVARQRQPCLGQFAGQDRAHASARLSATTIFRPSATDFPPFGAVLDSRPPGARRAADVGPRRPADAAEQRHGAAWPVARFSRRRACQLRCRPGAAGRRRSHSGASSAPPG